MERRDEGDWVVLIHPTSGREERLKVAESRLLPYVNAALSAKMVADRAREGGVDFPEYRVHALLTRLHESGFLEIEGHPTLPPLENAKPWSEPATAFEEDHQVTTVQPDNSLGLALSRGQDAPSPLPAVAGVDNEIPTSVDIDVDQLLMTGQFSRPEQFQPYTTGSQLSLNAHPKLKSTVRFTRGDNPKMIKATDTARGISQAVYEIEAIIARKMDGATSIADLAIAFEKVGVSAAQVESVAKQWRAYAFLEPFADPPPHARPAEAAPVAEGDAAARKARRRRRTRRRLLIFLALLAAPTATLQLLEGPLLISQPIVLVPVRQSPVRSEVDGTVARTEMTRGQQVKAGELLLTLDEAGLQAELAAQDTAISAAEGQLKKLQQGPLPEQLASAKALVARTANAVKLAGAAKAKLVRARKSAAQVEAAQKTLTAAVAAADAARADQARLLAPSGEGARAKAAELEKLKQARAAQSERLTHLEVRSPINGLLTLARAPEQGERITAGAEFAQVLDLTTMKIHVDLDPNERGTLTPESKVTVRLDSHPSRTFAARVESIDQVDQIVRVIASLENPELLLREEMTGFAEVDVGQRPLLTLIARQIKGW